MLAMPPAGREERRRGESANEDSTSRAGAERSGKEGGEEEGRKGAKVREAT
jgi:hypothetical protein